LSAAHVDIIKRGYEAVRGGAPPPYEDWHPDFVWDMSTFTGWPEDQTYPGVEGYKRFMHDWLEPFDHWEIYVERYFEAGDNVVAFVHQRGTAQASGASVDMHFAQIWSFKDGKVLGVQLYDDPAAALAAAGVEG
jgi:ketosteroid isomerase-like protein